MSDLTTLKNKVQDILKEISKLEESTQNLSKMQVEILSAKEDVVVITTGSATGKTFAIREYLSREDLTNTEIVMFGRTSCVWSNYVKPLKLPVGTFSIINSEDDFLYFKQTCSELKNIVIIIDSHTHRFIEYNILDFIDELNNLDRKVKVFVVDSSYELNDPESLVGRMGWLEYDSSLLEDYTVTDIVNGRIDLKGKSTGLCPVCHNTGLTINHISGYTLRDNPYLEVREEYLKVLNDLPNKNKYLNGEWNYA